MKIISILVVLSLCFSLVFSQATTATVYKSEDGTCSTVDGIDLLLKADFPQVIPLNTDVCRGFAAGNSGVVRSISLNLTLDPQIQFEVEYYEGADDCSGSSKTQAVTVFGVSSCVTSTGTLGTRDVMVEQPIVQGGEFSDPHFVPLNKKYSKFRYTPHFEEDGFYNIISNKFLQLNGYVKTFRDFPYHKTESPQYITMESFVVKAPKGMKNPVDAHIMFKLITDKTQSKYLGIQVSINGKIQKASLHPKPIFFFGEEYPRYAVTAALRGKLVFYSPYLIATFFPKPINHHPRLRLSRSEIENLKDHPKYKWSFIETIYFELGNDQELKQSHGILGQTLRDSNPYKKPFHDCPDCFVEGKVSDYLVEGPYGISFKYNQFN